jgi:carbonic anhydrase/acetyltransferase-like protein (isoleucine patch superfamily)
MSLQIVAFDPMLRVMGLPPALSRYSPDTKFRPLKTLLLSETPLVQGLSATFDDSCFVTVPAEGEVAWGQIKLMVHGARKAFSQVHLGLFGQAQGLTLAVADDATKVVIGTGAVVRGHIQCFGRPSVFIGDRSTLQGVRVMVGQADVVIGDDCLIGEEAWLVAQDPYPMIDLSTGEVLNTGRVELALGRHVLVGRRAQLLAHSKVGDGSVVAPGSTVDGHFGKHVWLMGAPATVKRESISWARAFGQEAPNFNAEVRQK